MFSNLRNGNEIYIIEKNSWKLDKGQVSQVMPQTMSSYTQLNNTVDITTVIDSKTIELKQLPANLSIADNQNGLVVADNISDLSRWVEATMKSSQDTLNSIDRHKKIVKECDRLLKDLNPQWRKAKEQEEKISSLESKMSGIEGSIEEMKNMLSKMLNKNQNR